MKEFQTLTSYLKGLETKSMSGSSELLPPHLYLNLKQKKLKQSFLRRKANIIELNSGSVSIPDHDNQFSIVSYDEGAKNSIVERREKGAKLETIRIIPKTFVVTQFITYELLSNCLNLEDYLYNEINKAILRKENYQMMLGNGNDEILGMVKAIEDEKIPKVIYNEKISLLKNLRSMYKEMFYDLRENACWIVNSEYRDQYNEEMTKYSLYNPAKEANTLEDKEIFFSEYLEKTKIVAIFINLNESLVIAENPEIHVIKENFTYAPDYSLTLCTQMGTAFKCKSQIFVLTKEG